MVEGQMVSDMVPVLLKVDLAPMKMSCVLSLLSLGSCGSAMFVW